MLLVWFSWLLYVFFKFKDTFGGYLLLCVFVLIIFIRSCFICTIVGLFVLLKKGQIVGLKSVFFCLVLCKVFTGWAKNLYLQEVFVYFALLGVRYLLMF